MSGPSARYAGGATGPVKFSAAEYADASLIDKFKMQAREWWSIVKGLETRPAPTPALESERQRLLSLATTVKDAIRKVTSLSDALAIPGLGILPLVPALVVGAALSAIAYWSSQYVSYRKKLSEYQYQRDLVGQGVPPTQAAQIAREQAAAGEAPAGPLEFVMRHWQWLAIGAGALLIIGAMKK